MKKYICKFLVFLLKKLGVKMAITIDYYTLQNGNSTFLQVQTYSNITSPPRIGEMVELFVNEQTGLYTVTNVIYCSSNIKVYIK